MTAHRPLLLLASILAGCSSSAPTPPVMGQVQLATSAFASLTVAGIWPGAGLGAVVSSAGDVNGDGKQDLLIAAPTGGAGGEGEVLVLHGPATAGPDLVLTGPEAGSGYGTALAGLGDVNGDGYDDIAIGAPSAFGGGVVQVYLGGPSGLAPSPDLVLTGSPASSFGAAVAGGDLTGDGLADLLVGAPLDPSAGWGAGSVSLFAGSVAGLDSVPLDVAPGWPGSRTGSALAVGDVDGDGVMDAAVASPLDAAGAGSVSLWAGAPTGFGAPLGLLGGVQSAEGCGTALDLADIDADGLADLIVGCPRYDAGLLINAGRLVGWSSAAGGLVGGGAWSEAGTIAGDRLGSALIIAAWPGSEPTLLAVAPGVSDVVTAWSIGAAGPTTVIAELPASAMGAQLGAGLASMDLTGDGATELVLGAPGSSISGANTGAVWTIAGGLIPFEATASSILTAATADSVAMGDFDGDGLLEVAAGTSAGNTIRWFDGLGAGSGASFSPAWPGPGTTSVHMRLASGDLDGDGDDELVAGSYVSGPGAPATGVVKVFDGDPASALSTEWSTVSSMNTIAALGWSVSVGDLDGDGIDDLVAGAPGWGTYGHWTFVPGWGAGSVQVRYGAPLGLPMAADWSALGSSGANFGYAVAVVPDVHGDGFDDLLVGAPFATGGNLSLYSGGSGGLGSSPSWSASRSSSLERLGTEVWGLGDIDQDGFGEIAAYAPDDGGGPSAIQIYSGSAGGPMPSPTWVIEVDQAYGWSGADSVDIVAVPGPTTAIPARLAVTSDPGPGGIRLVFLDVNGTAPEFGIAASSLAGQLAVGDIDSDGTPDLVRVGDDVGVHLGSGVGRITSPDQLTVVEGGAAEVLDTGAISVLANDLEAGWSATLVRAPVHGTLAFTPDGVFTYVHDGTDSVTDSWLYEISEAGVTSQPERVQITVLPFDDPPIPNAGGPYTVPEMAPLVLDSSGTVDDGPVSILWDCDGDGQFEMLDGIACVWQDDGIKLVPMLVADSGGHTATDVAVVTVSNEAPVIEPTGTSLQAVQFRPFTLDLDGDDVSPQDPTTWSLISAPPSTASIDPLLGTITWTPLANGPFDLTVLLTDDEGGFDTVLLFVLVDPDEDADGMGDDWEVEHGLDPTVDDTAEDPDGDGRPNLQEFLDGSDPDVFDGPTAPEPESPQDGTLVTGEEVQLRASAATSPVGAPMTYRMQLLQDDVVFLEVGGLPEIDGTARFQLLTEFIEDGIWTWHVRAEDPYVAGPWGTERTLRVDTFDDPPQGRPVLLFPRDGDVIGDEELSILFAATAQDPEGQTLLWTAEQIDADGVVLGSRTLPGTAVFGPLATMIAPSLQGSGPTRIRIAAEDPGGNRVESAPVSIDLGNAARLRGDVQITSPDPDDVLPRAPNVQYRVRDLEPGGLVLTLDSVPSMDGPNRVELGVELQGDLDRNIRGGFNLAGLGELLPAEAQIFGLLVAERENGTAQAPPAIIQFFTDDTVPSGDAGCESGGCTEAGTRRSSSGLLVLLGLFPLARLRRHRRAAHR